MDKSLPLFQRARDQRDRVATVDATGSYTYGDLLGDSSRMARRLGRTTNRFLVTPCFAYAAVQWGIWRAGGVAVPLGLSHPTPELEYVLEDSQASVVMADANLSQPVQVSAAKRGLRFLGVCAIDDIPDGPLPELSSDRRAMILYTSGTTSKPEAS